ncbi:hypothetical protein [Sinomicrobium sp. M5D2P17]
MKSVNYFFVLFCIGIFSLLSQNILEHNYYAREKGKEIIPPNGIISTESFVQQKGTEIVLPNGIFENNHCPIMLS